MMDSPAHSYKAARELRPRITHLELAAVALGVLAIGLYTLRLRGWVPYWDDWEVCKPLETGRALDWATRPHMDHVMVAWKPIFWAWMTLSRFDVATLQLVGAIIFLGSSLVLWLHVRTSLNTVSMRALCALVLLLPTSWENLTMGWQVHLQLAYALTVVALVALRDVPAPRASLQVAVASGAALLFYGGGVVLSGIAVVALLRGSVLSLRLRRQDPADSRRIGAAVAVAFGVLGVGAAVYLWVRQQPPWLDATFGVGTVRPLTEPIGLAVRMFGHLGAAFAPNKSYEFAAALGVALVAMGIIGAARRRELAWLGAFAVAFAASVAFARYGWGRRALNVSRYYQFVALGIPAVLAGLEMTVLPRSLRTTLALGLTAGALYVAYLGVGRAKYRRDSLATAMTCILRESNHGRRLVCAEELAPAPAKVLACLDGYHERGKRFSFEDRIGPTRE